MDASQATGYSAGLGWPGLGWPVLGWPGLCGGGLWLQARGPPASTCSHVANTRAHAPLPVRQSTYIYVCILQGGVSTHHGNASPTPLPVRYTRHSVHCTAYRTSTGICTACLAHSQSPPARSGGAPACLQTPLPVRHTQHTYGAPHREGCACLGVGWRRAENRESPEAHPLPTYRERSQLHRRSPPSL